MIFIVAHWMLEMIVLRFNMQGEDGIEHGKCHMFTFSMQEKDSLEHTNAKCHFLHILVNL